MQSTDVITFAVAALIMIVAFMGLIIYFVYSYREKQRNFLTLQRQKHQIDLQRQQLEETLQALRDTQQQLIQSEKLASLGELTAGIAHEIQNPLNFVKNFSEINGELLQEIREAIEAGKTDQLEELLASMEENENKVVHHTNRADSIVKSMLQHSRGDSQHKEPTDINTLVDECLRLSFHGMRARDKSFQSNFAFEPAADLPLINVVPQDLGRVFLNIFTNAFYAVNEKAHKQNDGYRPEVKATTKKLSDSIEIRIRDNGPGISPQHRDKLFQPFFTTKAPGKGTGLGLSISYDIITKGHNGQLTADSEPGVYTEFCIRLPIA